MPIRSRVFVVVVAAGQGQRLRESDPTPSSAEGLLPKAYQRVDHRCLLECALEALVKHPLIESSKIQPVIGAEHQQLYAALEFLPACLPACIGGDSRAASVASGLRQLREAGAQDHDYVLIHDAARPKPDVALIERLLSALDHSSAVIPVLPIRDALKQVDDFSPVSRENFVFSQTPQAFRFDCLWHAFEHTFEHAFEHAGASLAQFDDEAALVRACGVPVTSVEGQRDNIKITDFEDLRLLRQQASRSVSGTGFDLHRFDTKAKADTIRIAGLDVSHPHPLVGHSDGDVVLHALCDALYGSMALGDIGQHFPPDDPQWKDQDSVLFLRHALAQLAEHRGRLVHVDVTIIADRPKITPICKDLRRHLASLCALNFSQVSIKATTTEGLGFIDAHHAIAAQTLISVEFDRNHPLI